MVSGEYKESDELPADNWYPTKKVVMVHAPESWAQGTRVQLFVYPWIPDLGRWAEKPIAFTQNSVNLRKRMVGALVLLGREKKKGHADDGHAHALPRLRPGKYLIKAYLDSNERLKDNPTQWLPEEDLYGVAEIEAVWKKGFRNAVKIPKDLFRRRGSV